MCEIAHGRYIADTRVELTHLASGAALVTDPAREHRGGGTSFSPMDLAACALGTCAMTIMTIVAARLGADLSGMRMEVRHALAADRRRIASVGITLHLPAGVPGSARPQLEAAAHNCPVRNSLHPDVKVTLDFVYDC